MWNPVLFAMASGNLSIVKYFVEHVKVNAKLCLRDPVHAGEWSEVSPAYETRSKCFSVLVSIHKADKNMTSYFLNNLH